MHSQTVHYEIVDDRVQHYHQIGHPQVREGEQPYLTPINSVDDGHWKVQDVNIGHKESKIEFDEVPSLFSIRHREEVYDGKQDEIPYCANHTRIGDDNQTY